MAEPGTDARIAVVTGGNRGLGIEIVRKLAQRGLRVVLGSRSMSAGLEAREQLGAVGERVVVRELDVADERSVVDLVRWIHGSYRRCDVLVNNAAIAVDGAQDAMTADFDVVRRTMEVNLYGAWRLVQALSPAMRAGGYGRIVNVSSGVGRFGSLGTGIPAYRLSKTALNALTVIFADELRYAGILVNSCCPGRVRTEMGGGQYGVSPADAADTPVWLATLPSDGPTGGFFRDRKPLEW
ncbi:SDR family oxidoreductase [Actinoplanes utahensis]|uniref:Short-chain dehydrogenase n=1 Tax=Actinoplanes utahensis TaxID=1869 RepID=A0A0A6UTG3_ACTUT|nr:SDR family oxidoreductase [Actinoplanes utahensis]KHD78263.1 short-chain dehydrogenase [Actinoplanes utahensis]GIF28857.1 short-chain dehydrogenase [Actinoplanes utahensis]